LFYKKYSKDSLFIDALDSYIVTLSDPILTQIRNSDQGLETFKGFFYGLIDALLTNTFPRSCLMVNTIVELHYEVDKLNLAEVYTRYFGNMRKTYTIILERAIELGEIKNVNRIDKYADLLVGVIFGLSILYKVKPKEELHQFVDQQLDLIV
jgi:TetR/AcrR family transcriptional repressor of nem operon